MRYIPGFNFDSNIQSYQNTCTPARILQTIHDKFQTTPLSLKHISVNSKTFSASFNTNDLTTLVHDISSVFVQRFFSFSGKNFATPLQILRISFSDYNTLHIFRGKEKIEICFFIIILNALINAGHVVSSLFLNCSTLPTEALTFHVSQEP